MQQMGLKQQYSRPQDKGAMDLCAVTSILEKGIRAEASACCYSLATRPVAIENQSFLQQQWFMDVFSVLPFTLCSSVQYFRPYPILIDTTPDIGYNLPVCSSSSIT